MQTGLECLQFPKAGEVLCEAHEYLLKTLSDRLAQQESRSPAALRRDPIMFYDSGIAIVRENQHVWDAKANAG
jgi:hypothetical protein